MFDELLNASRLALSSVDFTNANRPAFLSDELTESLGDDVFLSLQENRSGNRFAVLASGANGDQATHEGQADGRGFGNCGSVLGQRVRRAPLAARSATIKSRLVKGAAGVLGVLDDRETRIRGVRQGAVGIAVDKMVTGSADKSTKIIIMAVG